MRELEKEEIACEAESANWHATNRPHEVLSICIFIDVKVNLSSFQPLPARLCRTSRTAIASSSSARAQATAACFATSAMPDIAESERPLCCVNRMECGPCSSLLARVRICNITTTGMDHGSTCGGRMPAVCP